MKLTPEIELVLELSRYLNRPLEYIMDMTLDEFNLWLEYKQKHPSLETILDTHLSNIQSMLSSEKSIALDYSLLLSQEDKDKIKEELKQQELLKSLKSFGKE